MLNRPMKLVASGNKSQKVLSNTEKDMVEKELKLLRHIRDVLDVKTQGKKAANSDSVAEAVAPPKGEPPVTSPTAEPAGPQTGSPDPKLEPATPHAAKEIDSQPAEQPVAKGAKAPKAGKAAKPGKAARRTKPESPAPETAGNAPQPEPAEQPVTKGAKAPKAGKATSRAKPESPEPPKMAEDPTTTPASDGAEKPPAVRPAPAKKPTAKKAPSPVRITAKKSVQIKPVKPGDAKPAGKPRSAQEPKKIPVKKPAPKKTAAKPSTKKAKKTSLIKSAKTPKRRKPASDVPNTLEDELAIQLTPEEIDSFQIEKVDMEKLTHKVCDILLRCESEGMLQADLYKKLKLSARNGARLSLKLERMGMVNRAKLLVDERWTYKLILKKTPVSTISLENAPCLVCPVEQKCSVDGDISPKTCTLIEEWVMADLKRRP